LALTFLALPRPIALPVEAGKETDILALPFGWSAPSRAMSRVDEWSISWDRSRPSLVLLQMPANNTAGEHPGDERGANPAGELAPIGDDGVPETAQRDGSGMALATRSPGRFRASLEPSPWRHSCVKHPRSPTCRIRCQDRVSNAASYAAPAPARAPAHECVRRRQSSPSAIQTASHRYLLTRQTPRHGTNA
jgi:hypothetical protein